MKKFKKSLMAGVMAGVLMTSSVGVAAGKSAAYAQLAGSGIALAAVVAQMLIGQGWFYCIPFGPFPNTDPVQSAAEYFVLQAIKDVKQNWEPKPAKEYQKAAEDNGSGGGSGGSGGGDGVSVENLSQSLSFVAASLKNVGIEAIEVGADLSSIASQETRTKILGELEYLQPKSSATTGTSSDDSSGTNKIPGAGSCEASYSVCLKEMTETEMNEVALRQQQNEQNFGTAGITHAELGLKSVQQAIANDGDSVLDKGSTSASSEKAQATLAAGKTASAQDLSALIGTGKNTVGAMKIVALMNLELAQRLNQGNMLQGATLTIEAARALSDTAGITD